MARLFAEGDLALLIDPRGRRYLVTLVAGRSFQSHRGVLPHESIIGQEDGCRLRTLTGEEFIVLAPTLSDYILKMPRSAQVIYPKDIGPILVYGDIFPGATVVEAGVGSGALSLAILRAIGPTGKLVSYEIRDDHAAQARRNIPAFLPQTKNHTLRLGDLYEGIEERDVDRMVLDLPEPWRAIPVAADALRSGGILISYLPTVLQLHQLHQTLARERRFEFIEAFEVLERPWYLARTSARPVHRMVAHTGFITRAVRCAPRTHRTRAELLDLASMLEDEGMGQGE